MVSTIISEATSLLGVGGEVRIPHHRLRGDQTYGLNYEKHYKFGTMKKNGDFTARKPLLNHMIEP
jgi:hypothetical protein